MVMHGATVGRGSTIAAGAVVLEHVHAPPFSLITGSPASIKPAYTDKDACLARAAKQAHQYCARAGAYRRSLREMLDQLEGADGRQWDAAAWEEAAARLGYPRLYAEGGDDIAGEGPIVAHHGVREGVLSPASSSATNRSDGCEKNEREAVHTRKGPMGGVASIVVAAVAGAVASVVVSALRKRP